nr:hypothetical protein [Mycobacterium sp. UM_NZ2]
MTITVNDTKTDFTEYSRLRYRLESAADLALAAAQEAGQLDADVESPLSWEEKAEQADRIWSGLMTQLQALDRLDR